MKLYIAGGCGEHGRNCFHVKGEAASFLVDCGLMAGEPGGGHPRLDEGRISGIQCVFLTHSHADHTGALPWLRQHGFSGSIIASRHTLDQLPFPVEKGIALEDICPAGEGAYGNIRIRWGRAGHCVGSVWYHFEAEEKTILFSGDYIEDTKVFACDALREKQADLAVLDCAYGMDETSYEDCCAHLLDGVRRLQKKYPLLVFPVPKFGRGMEILKVFLDNRICKDYYADAHFCEELAKAGYYRDWLKSEIPSHLVRRYTGKETSGILFISNPQLRTAETRSLAETALTNGGYAVMTGTVEEGTFSAHLLASGKMEMLRYPVHLNHRQFKQLVSENCFSRIAAYHSPDFTCDSEIIL